ncbi:hypothetical protein QYE76_067750 [Lolium multiflorum]|uniref:Uncharacterized protein n=1 Tax=Lolium multiflorum TaxID=4521 RepID=A0AAD8SD75_LOLMU|nr:hypothetical protein QYE76_067750 [Lolium multiflorum]
MRSCLLLLLLIAATGKAAAASKQVETTMDYQTHMEEMLQFLRSYHSPVYGSRDNFINGVKHGVIYTLTLDPILKGDETTVMPVSFETRRDSEQEAIQETARLALLHLANHHAAELKSTVFRLYPGASHPGADPRPQRPLVEGKEDATVAQLASFALAQASFAHTTAAQLGRTQDNLSRVHARQPQSCAELSNIKYELAAAQTRIAELEDAFFHGNQEDEEVMVEAAPPVQEQPVEEDADSDVPEQE